MTTKTIVIAVDNSTACLKAVEYVKEHFPIGEALISESPADVPLQTAVTVFIEDTDTIWSTSCLAHCLADHHPQKRRTGKYSGNEVAETEQFMAEIFIPAAISAPGPVEVFSTIVECEPDGSRAIGKAICEYLDKIPADTVVLMKKQRNIVERVFQGSVTAYCAAHSHVTVVVVAP